MVRLMPIDSLVCPAATSGIFDSWIGLDMLALVTSAIILIFLYLLATFFRSQNTMTFIKVEFFEIFTTLVILSFIIAVSTSVCTVKVGWFFPHSLNQDKTMYNVSMTYFDTVENKFETWMNMQHVINVYVDQMASATPYSRPLGIGLVATPLAGFASPIKLFLYNALTGMAIAYVINEAQKYVLAFATFGFLKWYLPIGVFLRSFTPTRRIGGTLIALSLNFIFFLPFVIMLSAESMLGVDPVTGDAYGVIAGVDSMVFQHWTTHDIGTDIGKFFKSLFLPDIDFASYISGGFLVIIGTWVNKVVGEIAGTILFIPLSTVGMAFTLGYLIPAFNILMFVQTTKFFSRMLGEEIDVTTLTRMI